MDSSVSSDDNGDTNLKNIYNGVPMFEIEHRYAFLRLKRVLS